MDPFVSIMDEFLKDNESLYLESLKKQNEEEQGRTNWYISHLQQYFPTLNFKDLFIQILRNSEYEHGTLVSTFFEFSLYEQHLDDTKRNQFQQSFSKIRTSFTQLPDNFLNPHVSFFRNRLHLVVSDRVDYVISLEEEQFLCSSLMNILEHMLAHELDMPSPILSHVVVESMHVLLDATYLKTHTLQNIENWIHHIHSGLIIQRNDPYLPEAKKTIRKWYLSHRYPITPWHHWLDDTMYVLDEQEFERIKTYILNTLKDKAYSAMNPARSNAANAFSEVSAIKIKYQEICELTLKKDE